jgi:hypothetical protein
MRLGSLKAKYRTEYGELRPSGKVSRSCCRSRPDALDLNCCLSHFFSFGEVEKPHCRRILNRGFLCLLRFLRIL